MGADAGHGGGAVEVFWASPESVLRSAIDISAPVQPSILECPTEAQDLIGGAKWVFRAGTQKKRAAHVGPVLSIGFWQAGMDESNTHTKNLR